MLYSPEVTGIYVFIFLLSSGNVRPELISVTLASCLELGPLAE